MRHLTPRTVIVGTRRTTIRLETEYWIWLRHISQRDERSIRDICTELDQIRAGSLASAVRLYVLKNLGSRRQRDSSQFSGNKAEVKTVAG